MFWRQIHRWLGLVAGTVALVLGLTGAVLSLDPVLSRWQAQPSMGESPDHVGPLLQLIGE